MISEEIEKVCLHEMNKSKSSDTGVEDISANAFSDTLSKLWGGKDAKLKIKSNMKYSELITLVRNLEEAKVNFKRTLKSFTASKKLKQNDTGPKIEGAYIWSKSGFAKLVAAMDSIVQLREKWHGLLDICSKDPYEPKCWMTQAGISKTFSELNTMMAELESEIDTIVLVDGTFNNRLLYLEDAWVQTETDDGQQYIYNISDSEERYWLKKAFDSRMKAPSAEDVEEVV